MVRIQSKPLLNEAEKEKLSVLASIARLHNKAPFYKRIVRFRQKKHPFVFHEKNVKSVKQLAKRMKSDGLSMFAAECKALIQAKLDNL